MIATWAATQATNEGAQGRHIRPPDWLWATRSHLAVIAAGNLIWEAAQLPLYTIWTTAAPWDTAIAVLH